jgi:Ser/Thr protein kinase RdoA (MazF antagonist)
MTSLRSPERIVLEELARSRGARLIGRFDHGAGGTSLVELCGSEVVLKAWPEQSPTAANLLQAVSLMAVMRARGVPIPELLETGQLAGQRYAIYERRPGRWPARPSRALLRELTDVVAREREAAPSEPGRWPRTVRAMLYGEGDPLFEISPSVLEAHPDGRRLLSRARARLDECDPSLLTGGDIMHGDFAPENALVHEGRLSAVVDWEQCRPGDATLDLVGILFDLELGAKAGPSIRAEFRHSLRQAAPGPLLALYVAIFAARYASWGIGTELEAEVLALGERLTSTA